MVCVILSITLLYQRRRNEVIISQSQLTVITSFKPRRKTVMVENSFSKTLPRYVQHAPQDHMVGVKDCARWGVGVGAEAGEFEGLPHMWSWEWRIGEQTSTGRKVKAWERCCQPEFASSPWGPVWPCLRRPGWETCWCLSSLPPGTRERRQKMRATFRIHTINTTKGKKSFWKKRRNKH